MYTNGKCDLCQNTFPRKDMQVSFSIACCSNPWNNSNFLVEILFANIHWLTLQWREIDKIFFGGGGML